MNRYVKIREMDGGLGVTKWVPVEEVAAPGPPGSLMDDPAPALSANLNLNGHKIIGELESDVLVVDGGLL